MNVKNIHDFLSFAESVALRAAAVQFAFAKKVIVAREKEDHQLVTDADEEINKLVIHEVEKRFPDHSVYGEEARLEKDSSYAWVCDPLDGTIPFLKGLPVSTFSLALIEDGSPIVGVVSDPWTNRLYTAASSLGAYCNGEPIRVSARPLERHAVVNVEWWPDAAYDVVPSLHELSQGKNIYLVNISGVVNASCLVARGSYEASVYAGTKGKNVDIAAVKVIVEEAGGKVTDLFGQEQRYDRDINGAIVSNGITHNDLVSSLKELKQTR